FNRVTHARRLAASDSKWLAAPNTEMLYSNAWLDLSQGPVLLEIPDMGSRYYVVQLLDFFANSYAHLGSRTLGNRGGRLVIEGPGWSGQVPEGLTVLESPTSFAWILARIHVRDGEALPAVNALQAWLEGQPRASGCHRAAACCRARVAVRNLLPRMDLGGAKRRQRRPGPPQPRGVGKGGSGHPLRRGGHLSARLRRCPGSSARWPMQ